MRTTAKILICALILGALCAFAGCTNGAEDGKLLDFEINADGES